MNGWKVKWMKGQMDRMIGLDRYTNIHLNTRNIEKLALLILLLHQHSKCYHIQAYQDMSNTIILTIHIITKENAFVLLLKQHTFFI